MKSLPAVKLQILEKYQGIAPGINYFNAIEKFVKVHDNHWNQSQDHPRE